MSNNLFITKASGDTVPFSAEKLRQSLRRAGAEKKVIDRIEKEIEQRKVYDLETDKVIKKENPVQEKMHRPSPSLFNQKEPQTPRSTPQNFQTNFTVEPKETPKNEEKQEFIIHDLDSDKVEQVEKVVSSPAQNLINDYEEDIQKKVERLNDRKDKLKSISANSSGMTPEEFKQMLEIPAYKRNNTPLSEHPHSSERSISRFQLNEDNDILGNNRFLHDNVD